MFFKYLAGLCILLLALLIGSRNVVLVNRLFQPLTYSLPDWLEILGGGSYFIKNLKKYDSDIDPKLQFVGYLFKQFVGYLFKKYLPLLLSPASLLLLYVCYSYNIWWLVGASLAGAAGIIFSIFIILVACTPDARNDVINYITNLFYGKTNWLEDEDEVNLVMCNGKTKPMKASELPPKHRTIRLRFLDLKSKVCRPFSM